LVDKIDDGNTNKERIYIYGATFLLAIRENNSETYIIRDHLGSTRLAVSQDGSAGFAYSYDALGKTIADGRWGASEQLSWARYFYTGQELDEETGLQNFRARFYDDDLFRFYAMDPAGQQTSPYAFSGNSPLIYRDKNGKFFFVPILIGAAIGGLINLGTQAYMANASGKSFSLVDGLVAFGIGAGAGGVGVATGGVGFAAAGGGAAGAGGFAAGAAGAMTGYLASSPIQIIGNSAYFGTPIPTAGEFFTGLATSGLTGGIINGSLAAYNGKSFFSGVINNSSTTSVSSISSVSQVTNDVSNKVDDGIVTSTNIADDNAANLGLEGQSS
jgi:RHS repeat-associated protein